jgi:hypothetical protein
MVAKYLMAGVAASALIATVAFAETPATTPNRADPGSLSGRWHLAGPRFTRPLLGPFDDTALSEYGEAPSALAALWRRRLGA